MYIWDTKIQIYSSDWLSENNIIVITVPNFQEVQCNNGGDEVVSNEIQIATVSISIIWKIMYLI